MRTPCLSGHAPHTGQDKAEKWRGSGPSAIPFPLDPSWFRRCPPARPSAGAPRPSPCSAGRSLSLRLPPLLLLLLLVAFVVLVRENKGREAPAALDPQGGIRAPLLPQEECNAFKQRLLEPSMEDQQPGTSTQATPTPEAARQGVGAQGKEYRRLPGSCWSRAEWGCFGHETLTAAAGSGTAPPARDAPSEAFTRLLQEYSRHWKSCTLKETPQQVRDGLLGGSSLACQYMLWAPSPTGLGNNLASMASAFLYSLLTLRVLLIDERSMLADLFCEPFQGLSWAFPHTLLEEISNATYPFREALSKWRQYDFRLDEPAPAILPWYIWVPAEISSEVFFCPSFHKWARGSSALLAVSNMYWVPGLYHIGEFRERLEVLFPTRKVLPVLASVLFRPNNNVWSLLTDKMTQLRLHTLAPGPSSTRVGVQYRRDFGLHPQDALQATAQCLEALATSAPRDFPLRHVPSDPRGDGRPAADGGPTGAPLPGAPSRLLVASVDREFREAVANGSVLGIQGQEVTVLTTDSAQVSNDSAHNERALVDMLALAFSSTVLLLTPFSSFGYATAAFSSATPYFLSDTCSATTAEACFLLPPKRVTCPGAVDRGTFSIEYGRMGGKGEPVLEACPDVVWLEAYYLRTGRQFECCNHGFRLIQR